MILYNIHWNKTAFADYLPEAQECTSSELKQGFRCICNICCVTGIWSAFSNSSESSVSLILISSVADPTLFPLKSHPISPEIVTNTQYSFNFHFSSM